MKCYIKPIKSKHVIDWTNIPTYIIITYFTQS